MKFIVINEKTGKKKKMIEILEFYNTPNEKDTIIGSCIVEVNEKMKLLFIVFKSKNGKPFCKPPSFKADERWLPSFELTNSPKMNELCKLVTHKLIEFGYIK